MADIVRLSGCLIPNRTAQTTAANNRRVHRAHVYRRFPAEATSTIDRGLLAAFLLLKSMPAQPSSDLFRANESSYERLCVRPAGFRPQDQPELVPGLLIQLVSRKIRICSTAQPRCFDRTISSVTLAAALRTSFLMIGCILAAKRSCFLKSDCPVGVLRNF